MKLKRVLALILALILATAVLAGCATDNDEPKDDGQKVTDDKKTDGDDEPEEMKEFTMFYGMANAKNPVNYGDTKIGAIIEEKLNAHLEVEYLVGDPQTKVGIMVASGEYPDFIWGNEYHNKFIEAGAAIPLEDMIEKSGDNVKKVYGDILDQHVMDDGHIYFLTPYREDANTDREGLAFYIQRAVLEEFGWPVIKTWDDYVDVIERYAEKYPEINGKPTIGFELIGSKFYMVTNPPNFLSGFPNDGEVMVDPDTLEATVYANTDLAKRHFKDLNELYNKGLMDEEAFVMNWDQYVEKMSSGRVLGLHAQRWMLIGAESALDKLGMDERKYVPIALVYDEGIKDNYMPEPQPTIRDGLSISTSCEDPEGAFAFLNGMLDEEIQKLIHWGVEGEDYSVDDNGMFYRTEDQRELTRVIDSDYYKAQGIKHMTTPWPKGFNVMKYADGNVWSPDGSFDEVYATYDDYEKKILEAYGVKSFVQLFSEPSPHPWPYAWTQRPPEGSDLHIERTKMGEADKEILPRVIMAPEGEFEDAWNEYLEEYDKIDTEGYAAYITERLQESQK